MLRSASFLLALCTVSAAFAQAVPRAAVHRAELTRIAHSTWGLDAPVPMFAAQIHQESSWNPAILSSAGATGLAQFMPATATWWCALNKLSTAECQPTHPTWAMRALVGYDKWLYQGVYGKNEFDQLWATLRSYNGGQRHWKNEAATVKPATDRASIDAACGRASRSKVHCPENLQYPDRILTTLQYRYASWGRLVTPEPR